jgi:hypothetical protein
LQAAMVKAGGLARTLVSQVVTCRDTNLPICQSADGLVMWMLLSPQLHVELNTVQLQTHSLLILGEIFDLSVAQYGTEMCGEWDGKATKVPANLCAEDALLALSVLHDWMFAPQEQVGQGGGFNPR